MTTSSSTFCTLPDFHSGKGNLHALHGKSVARAQKPHRLDARPPLLRAANYSPADSRHAIRSTRLRRPHKRPGQTGRTVHIRFDPAALIMRRRHHWNRLLRHVDAKTKTRFVNVRKTFLQKFARLMRDIEKNAVARPERFISASIARATMSRGASERFG